MIGKRRNEDSLCRKRMEKSGWERNREILLEFYAGSSEIFILLRNILEHIYVGRKDPAEKEKWVMQKRKGITQRGKSLCR